MYFMDLTSYGLVIIAAVLSLAASGYLKSTFNKYSRVRCRSGITGAEAAIRILKNTGIHDVQIERVSGNLTDHYDTRTKTLRLSDTVYDSNSIAAVGVAAHECGHAIQDYAQYGPLLLRSILVPAAQFGSTAAMPLIIAGIVLGEFFNIGTMGYILIDIGIIGFGIAVLFQLITLPVEFNASRRAMESLSENGILGDEEATGSRRVLNAAALTYVAAASVAVLHLIRLLALRGRR